MRVEGGDSQKEISSLGKNWFNLQASELIWFKLIDFSSYHIDKSYTN